MGHIYTLLGRISAVPTIQLLITHHNFIVERPSFAVGVKRREVTLPLPTKNFHLAAACKSIMCGSKGTLNMLPH
jgi:hypothetical protein